MTTPFDQSRYQVRTEWGTDGLRRLAPSDVVVVVDVLGATSAVVDAVADGERPSVDALRGEALAVVRGAVAAGSTTVLADLRTATAVAGFVLGEQERRADRTSIAVIATGDRDEPGSPLRFAVEDLLGAGAVVDALGARGIDHTSPEAAAACESLRGLRGAVRHLLSASGSGQELLGRVAEGQVAEGQAAEGRVVLEAAARTDAISAVPVVVDGAFQNALSAASSRPAASRD